MKDPESAPRCPNCGYNLYGLPGLICPECGKTASLEEARWASDVNKSDRQAMLAERLAVAIGWALFLAGLAFYVLHLSTQSGFNGYFFLRIGGGALVITLVILYALKTEDEPYGMPLLIIGSLWFVICFAIWFVR